MLDAVTRPGDQAGSRAARAPASVAVIGAGSSGLAVLKALREAGIAVVCFERGSDVGGLWQYENDNGLSSAYASLHTNASRARMQYPSFPMPVSYGDFPNHSDMAAYLRSYAEVFSLRELIRFRASVTRLEPGPDGTWCVSLDDGSAGRYTDVVIAVGHDWCPKLPRFTGHFSGESIHAHEYRAPEPFAGRRVLVVGAGPSAAEIAVEVASCAARTCMSVRRGAHVIPRWIAGKPYDRRDVEPLNRMPWPLLNLLFRRAVARELGSLPTSWPTPAHRLLEGVPIPSSDLLPAIRRRNVTVKPAIEQLVGDRVRFCDRTEEPFDRIIYATGYRISLPFLHRGLIAPNGRELPLFRRIVPPELPGLFFAGFTDAPGGLLPLVEAQGEWIAAVLTGRLRLPATKDMWAAIERAERRTRERFPDESPHSIRCDPHAYRRLLRSDLRQARAGHRERPNLGARPRPVPGFESPPPKAFRCRATAATDVTAPQERRDRPRASFIQRFPKEINSMDTLSKAYPSEDAARRAVGALRAAGAPPRDIRLLTSRPPGDVRREPIGGFAGPVGPDAPLGSYASAPRRRGQATGSFATGSFAGDPDHQRQGSFADVERVVIVTYKDEAEHPRVTGYGGARQLLRRSALDDDAVDRAVKQLHLGHAVVLVDISEITPSDARAHLDQIAHAA